MTQFDPNAISAEKYHDLRLYEKHFLIQIGEKSDRNIAPWPGEAKYANRYICKQVKAVVSHCSLRK
jgi:hypothetical protein